MLIEYSRVSTRDQEESLEGQTVSAVARSLSVSRPTIYKALAE